MYQFKGLEDTIVAISTATGQAGIGIVRLSGHEALLIAEKMFSAKNKKKISSYKNFTVHYGWVSDKDGGVIDEVLLTVMRAPKSYTMQDVVELSCHGGITTLKKILHTALNFGARLAEPGEFTKRAFLNSRIDLTQAEAVLDIIHSKTDAFLKVSNNQLKGELSRELEIIRDFLMNAYVEIEAIINFPEDGIDASSRRQIYEKIKTCKRKVDNLLSSSDQGRILKEGIKIVLCGKPNVGKSSLLNILLRTDRAIVSDVAGTTRDTIEESAQIKGIPLQLIDTAGILEPRDMIEQEAIKRSRMYIESADMVLFVVDANSVLSKEDDDLIAQIKGRNVLVVINKDDLDKKADLRRLESCFSKDRLVKVSALTKKGIDELEDRIVENVWQSPTVEEHGILISNVRHIDALKKVLSALEKAEDIVGKNISLEFASEEIKIAVNQLDSITGKNIDQDLLDNIFSQFCIGK